MFYSLVRLARNNDIMAFMWPDNLERASIIRCLRDARGSVHGRLLDAGCGDKPYVDIFRQSVSAHIGIDVARRAVQRPGLEGPDVVGDVGSLPFADESFDSVLCTQVLEHLPNPGQVMNEFHRVLRPGGTLIVTTPQTWGLHAEPHDYYRYTRCGLAHLARSAGFEVVRLQSRGGFWVTIAQMLSNRIYDRFAGFPRVARLPIRLVCALVQACGRVMAAIDRSDGLALGHGIIARRDGEARPACASRC